MENLLKEQQKLATSIAELHTNYKKDGADRKTKSYIEKKVAALEQLYKQYEDNHDALLTTGTTLEMGHGYSQERRITTDIYKKFVEDLRQRLNPPETSSDSNLNHYHRSEPLINGSETTNIKDEKLQQLKKHQDIKMRALYKEIESANLLVENNRPTQALKLSLKHMEKMMDKITELHEDICMEVSQVEEASSKYFTEAYYDNIKTEYDNIVIKITMEIESSSIKSDVRLPRIEIPQFYGDYIKWTRFADTFTKLIHENKQLNNTHKINHLKSHIGGAAAKLINHLESTGKNYETAWGILSNRYNNKKLLVTNYLTTLWNIRTIQVESATSIRNLHDTVTECLYGIRNTGINTASWNSIVIFMICKKLDSETRRLYESSLEDPKEFQQITEFLKFLEGRFQSLEASSGHKTGTVHQTKQQSAQTPQRQSFVTTTNICVYCQKSHTLQNCQQFQTLSVTERNQIVMLHKLCRKCFSPNHGNYQCSKTTRCTECNGQHHTLLHVKKEIESIKANVAQHNDKVLLATALLKVKNNQGGSNLLRALIDPGSQATFITEEAAQLLNLPKRKVHTLISGISTSNEMSHKQLEIQISPRFPSTFHRHANALILKNITKPLPDNNHIELDDTLLNQILLADPTFNTPGPIDLLIGADLYGEIIQEGLKRDAQTKCIAQKTHLGWIISGRLNRKHEFPARNLSSLVTITDIDRQLKQLWQAEELHPDRVLTAEEIKCEEHFQKTHIRLENGSYEVRIPFNTQLQGLSIGESKNRAIARLIHMEKRFKKDADFKNRYHDFMNEYIQLNHMELIRDESVLDISSTYYIPHHAVIKEDSKTTKLRVVFDASCKTTTNMSLNQIMHTGPTLQDDLTTILMRWRKHRYVVTADIEKMFRQIKIAKEDSNLQLILWRAAEKDPIQTYRLRTVTYGTAAATYLATKTLRQLAIDDAHKYPLGSQIALKDFYVDDLLSGADTLEEATVAQNQLYLLLQGGGFNLRKWNSNNMAIIQHLPEHLKESGLHPIEFDSTVKTLGLYWNSITDTFHIKVKQSPANTKITKRTILSDASKIFDPLGWLAPVVIRAKILLQDLWASGTDWDTKVHPTIEERWHSYTQELPLLEKITIDRWVNYTKEAKAELHGFCDASSQAYAAVVYIKIRDKTRIIAAKTKVAPLNQTISLPRLELNSAVLLSRLLLKVRRALELNKEENIFCWTDSMAALGWIKGKPQNHKTFVANRITEIQSSTNPSQWHHVISNENPADCASRGINPSQLLNHVLWWKGPPWLKLTTYSFRSLNIQELELAASTERKTVQVFISTVNTAIIDFTRFSSFQRLIRSTAYVHRFISNTRSKSKNTSQIQPEELTFAVKTIVKIAQAFHFKDEIKQLKNNQPLPKRSTITTLHPFLDGDGLLRVGGRLNKSNLTFNEKHPIMLPRGHHVAKLIIREAHQKTLHGGIQATLAYVRQRFWIVNAKNSVRHMIRNCVTCIRYRKLASQQLMGILPPERVTPASPFSNSGVDYAGPITLKLHKGRCNKTHKGYIAIFICMATKAVHLELVSDLTTDAFLAAFKRFTSRRGLCHKIFSDCGTNFVGANKQLAQNQLTEIAAKLGENGTEWHFIPPGSPHFGGLWEAGVKSTKYHLRRILGGNLLTFEELTTTLYQIEACLNSRPLVPVTNDIDDDSVLTPGHFLIGRPIIATPEPDITNVKIGTRWNLLTKITQQFWKQWCTDYLSSLQKRSKWLTEQSNIKVGELVIVKDELLPPTKWSLARVIQVHNGSDGLVRVVTLKQNNNIIKRNITKICRLTSNNEPMEDVSPNQESTRVTRSKNKIPATNRVMSMLTMLLVLGTVGSKANNNFQLTQWNNSPGIYFDLPMEDNEETEPVTSSAQRRQQPSRKVKHHRTSTVNRLVQHTCMLLCIIGLASSHPIARDVDPAPLTITTWNNSGMYFDKIARVELLATRWKLIIQYNLSSYWQEMHNVETGLEMLEDACKLVKPIKCDLILQQLHWQFDNIQQDNEFLLQNNLDHQRMRRGVGDSVGLIFGDMFGILSQREAEQYENNFEQIQLNEEYTLKLLKNQTSVLDNTLKLFKHSNNITTQHLQLLMETQRQFEVELTQLSEYRTYQDKSLGAILLSLQLGLSIKHLEDTQRGLIDVLLGAQHHIIHPSVLSPIQLEKEISNILKHVQKSTIIPGHGIFMVARENVHVACEQSFALVIFFLVLHCNLSFSRHHGIRHSRHKRNHGAHLYLTSSFIIPGGDTAPGDKWGEWGAPSECSRSCGGGVAYQTRECHNLDADNKPKCRGGYKKYFSCNTQDCPDDEIDFRQQQCSHFDHQPFEGLRYEWVPYTKAPNPCELNCMPRGERFYYRHKLKVIDGTRCNDETLDVCVDGTCQPVGCDMMLGSNATEDKCRKCSGDGSTCQTESGLLDTNYLLVGYNDILLLPAGATNIDIKEVAPSNNYLAIRNLTAHYYLNGNWRIDFPRTMWFAGCYWHYERKPQGFAAPDHLKCLGPTTEPIFLVLLQQDRNVGIKYEYFIPEAQNLPAPDSYAWTLTQYGPCSVSCGGGFQTRNVTCNSRSTLELVESKLCDINAKPSDTQQCSQEACPPRWVESDWSKCSEPCGNNGTQERTVFCERMDAHGKASKVADAMCASELGKKPAVIQECNVGVECPEWHLGPWRACSKLCGDGVQTRTVTCYRKDDDGVITVLADGDCPGAKPETSKSCMIRPCEGIDWITTAWSGCKACGQTKETRTAYCGTQQGKIYASSLCDAARKPKTVQECSGPPCEFQWYTSQWSKCSSECNDGVQTRNVVCGAFDGTEIHKATDEAKCDKSLKPNNTRSCEPKEDGCVGEWFAGPWKACSKECGGGRKERTVVCFVNGASVKPTLCNQADILFSTADCNTDKCSKDENIPASSAATLVEEKDDDDEDEYVDMDECDDSTEISGDDDIIKVIPTDPVDFDQSDTTDTTESTLRDDELMLSDATGFELASKSTSMPLSSTVDDGSGDEETGSGIIESRIGAEQEPTSRGLDITTDEEGSGYSSLTTDEIIEKKESTLVGSSRSSDDSSTDAGSTTALDEITTTTESGVTSTETGTTTSDLETSTDSGSTTTAVGGSSTDSESSTDAATTDEDGSTTVSGTTSESDSTTTAPSSSESGSTEDSTTDGQTTESDDDFIPITFETQPPKLLDVQTIIKPTVSSAAASTASTDDSTEASGSSETSDSEVSTTAFYPTSSSSSSESESSESSSSSTEPGSSLSTSDESTESEITTVSSDTTTISSSDSTSDPTSDATSDSTSDSTSEITTDTTEETTTEQSSSSDSSTTVESSSTSDETTPTSETTLTSDETTGTTDSSTTPESSTSDSSVSTDSKSTDEDGSTTTDSPLSTTTGSDSTSDTTFDLQTASIVTDSSTTEDSSSTLGSSTDESSTSDSDETDESTDSSTTIATDSSTDSPTDGSTDDSTGTSIGSSSSTDGFSDSSTTVDGTATTESSFDSSSLKSTDSDGTTSATGLTDLTTESASDSTTQGVTDVSSSDPSIPALQGRGLFGDDSTEGVPTTETVTGSSTLSSDDGTTESPVSTTQSVTGASASESDSTGTTLDEGSGSTTDDVSGSTFLSTDSPSKSTDIEGSTIESSTLSSTEEGTTIDIWTTTESATEASKYDDLTTPNTLATAIDRELTTRGPKKCKRRKPKKPKTPACKTSEFGCCPDGRTKAKGPFDEGCHMAETCNETAFGCCRDGLSPATGKNYEGCPPSICHQTLFKCCPDDYTTAEGPDFEGCPIEISTTTEMATDETDLTTESSGSTDLFETETTESSGSTMDESLSTISGDDELFTETTTQQVMHCAQSTYGCCPDGISEATGENFHGCDIIDKDDCTASYYGCCDDNKTPALGANGEGCASCIHSQFGCCPDNKHPAHGPHNAGCCLNSQFGCCPDNIMEAQGPTLEGCGCDYSAYGCCPDKVTPARGYDNVGCGCEHSPHGCCSDQLTPAKGANFEGCPCHTSQFGCCPDGITVPQGPHGYGCHCTHSKHKCCGDNVTPAQGPNAEGCTCANSEFGCCPDGVTDAKGTSFEGCTNIPQSPQSSCGLPSEKGECSNYTVKYYFDANYGGCSRFWYGGCGGNGNKFDSQDDCEDVCAKPEGKSVCDLPKVKGACDGYFPMYYYDAERKTCSQFIYGGCLGNNNRFQTIEECLQLCSIDESVPTCEQPVDEGPCNGTYERWYFDKESEVCRLFNYGGCKGNKNNFITEHACMYGCKKPGVLRDSCKLDKSEGECGEKDARWYFSESDNKCMPFYFTGCGGNKNNYESIEDCEQSCPKKIDLDLCHFPAEIGDGQNYTTKWYYDTREATCRQFYYGGSGGNKNNFDSEDDCLNRCSPQPTTPPPPVEPFNVGHCALPDDVGPCNRYENRWYYSSDDGLCHQFVYGGCGGNHNNFQTSTECNEKCADSQDPCTLPAIQGNCDENITRWYYEDRVGYCLEFVYTGCGANRNNFFTHEKCEEKCGRAEEPAPQEPEEGEEHKPDEQLPPTAHVQTVKPPTVSASTDYCNDPLDHGNDSCDELRESISYYYNAEVERCEAFAYIGCGGNGNRFDTMSQCERQCGVSKGKDVCSEPHDIGPCGEWVIQHYYNTETKTCNAFYYGGCGGNGNRFDSNEECESVCIAREEPISNKAICLLRPSNGKCNSTEDFSSKRYYFDDARGTCMVFIYSGCAGNQNNFKTLESCVDFCSDGTQPAAIEHTEAPHEEHKEIDEPEEVHPCQIEDDECNKLNCPYGIAKEYNEKGCEICSCDDPCHNHKCDEDSRCSVDFVPDDQQTHDAPIFIAICRQIRKPGECPTLANATRCERECHEDSDCRGDKKCCVAGCGTICVPPTIEEERAPSTAAPLISTSSPYPVVEGGIPTVLEHKPENETNVNVGEGGVATLRCFATGYPYPTIQWKRGGLIINTNLGRYHLTSTGDLQIVQLHKTDSGSYVCVADNGLGPPVTRTIELTIDKQTVTPTYIIGERNSTQIVTLNQPATLRCLAGGVPNVYISWWKGKNLIPYTDTISQRFEITKDYSLVFKRVELADLGTYLCEAYSGVGKPVSIQVTLKALGPVHIKNPEDEIYRQYLVSVPEVPKPSYPYRPTAATPPRLPPKEGKPKIPKILATALIRFPNGTQFEPNKPIVLECNVTGSPKAVVRWYKDEVELYPTKRVRISEIDEYGSSQLTVNNSTKDDTGYYKCEAINSHSKAYHTEYVVVEGIYVPASCTDNQFFANCGLIVEGNYCNHKYYSKFCCRSCTLAGQLSWSHPNNI